MSATTGSSPYDVAEQIARIRRAQEETEKFAAEQHKLTAEALKLTAETAKLRRDTRIAPWLAVVAIAGGIGGVLAGVQTILHLTGVIR